MDADNGYLEALRLLKTRFGSPHVIANAWVKKISEGPGLKPNDVDGLRKYADDLRSAMLTLKAMGKVNEVDNQMRMVKIVARLPMYLQGRWRSKAVEYLEATGEYPYIEQLVDFVNRASDEASDPIFGLASGNFKREDNSHHKFTKRSMNYSAQTSATEFPPSDCPIIQRLEFVTEKRLCFNCFMNNHSSRFCRKPSKCQVQGCIRKHSRLIHLPVKPNTDNHQTMVKDREWKASSPIIENQLKAESSACDVQSSKTPKVALPIIQVQVSVQNSDDKVKTYALLDSGSTNTFCSNFLLDKLGVKGHETMLSLTTLEKINSKTSTRVSPLTISDASNRMSLQVPIVFGTSTLSMCSTEPVNHQNVDEWPHLKGINFPQVDRVNVGLIIGQDVPVALTPIDVKKGLDGEPYAVQTALGWVLNGPLGIGEAQGDVTSHFVHVDSTLDVQVERFWKMEMNESLSDNNGVMSQQDKRTIKLWDETTEMVDGHYEMKYPFKSRPPNLPNNYSVAESRLECLGKRLIKDGKLFTKYDAGIKELLDKAYIEKVKNEEVNKVGTWYIPHHAVFNENKPDKLRIVFDCAAKFCGTSLNEQVNSGPDLTNTLIRVLLRFREGPIGVMGDIESMFHQVKVPETDRDYLRFLWFSEDRNKPPEVYRMTVHLFGGVWSPSCASYALRKTAIDNKSLYDEEVIQTVLKLLC